LKSATTSTRPSDLPFIPELCAHRRLRVAHCAAVAGVPTIPPLLDLSTHSSNQGGQDGQGLLGRDLLFGVQSGRACRIRQARGPGGGRFLARGTAAKAYEKGLTQRVVIIEFDSVEKAAAAHDSPGYQAALKVLGNAVQRDLRIVEGLV
jgi:uncharacterized protein (DUF1330 family)